MRIYKLLILLVTSYLLYGCVTTRTDGPMPADLQPTLQQQNQTKFERATTF